jgi:hypothetical protein
MMVRSEEGRLRVRHSVDPEDWDVAMGSTTAV